MRFVEALLIHQGVGQRKAMFDRAGHHQIVLGFANGAVWVENAAPSTGGGPPGQD